MNHSTVQAGAIPAIVTRPRHRNGLLGVALALVALFALAAAALMARASVDGAAPPATLSVIGETFDKGF
jgi:drug/metabolite transporter (DMT)-like permease